MMLCVRGTPEDIPRLTKAGCVWSLKVDGVRCMADIEDGTVTLTSREGVTITSQYPEVVESLRELSGSWRLDGEIAVNDERGLPSWPLTAKRHAQTRFTSGWAAKLPATFHAFDLLTADGRDVRSLPFIDRFAALEDLGLQVVLHTTDGEALWKVVCEHGLEGMVAKRPHSRYRTGRSSDWVKIKRTQTVTCLVGGFDPGEGSRASTFGALHLYLIGPDEPKQVGRVGSGFSDKELAQVMQAMHHPPLIVEVKYLDVSPDGLLRQPVFLRIRSDADITDCTLDQLTRLTGGAP